MKHFLSIAVLGLLSAFMYASAAQAQQFGSREALVLVEPVQFEQEKNRVEAVGTAEAARSITIYPAVGDRVVAVYFEPGQVVEEGGLGGEAGSAWTLFCWTSACPNASGAPARSSGKVPDPMAYSATA